MRRDSVRLLTARYAAASRGDNAIGSRVPMAYLSRLHGWPRRAEEKATKGGMRSHRMIGEFTPACARARRLRGGGRKLPWPARASTARIGRERSAGDAGGFAMKFPRRKFLHLAAGAAALPALSGNANAQSYPTRPVRIVVGSTPGSAADIIARLTARWLSERLGQQIIVENPPGGGDNNATGLVARAQRDGYTLLYVIPPNAINATLYPTLDFNFLRDIAPIGSIIRTPSVMEVNLSVPAKTVPEFIAYAKANPGKINMATLGPGSGQHLFGELFMMMTG